MVTLEMLNREKEDSHYSVTGEVMFEKIGYCSRCIGSTDQFFPLEQLKEEHYLSNEQIKLALAKCLEQMLLRSQSISVL